MDNLVMAQGKVNSYTGGRCQVVDLWRSRTIKSVRTASCKNDNLHLLARECINSWFVFFFFYLVF